MNMNNLLNPSASSVASGAFGNAVDASRLDDNGFARPKELRFSVASVEVRYICPDAGVTSVLRAPWMECLMYGVSTVNRNGVASERAADAVAVGLVGVAVAVLDEGADSVVKDVVSVGVRRVTAKRGFRASTMISPAWRLRGGGGA